MYDITICSGDGCSIKAFCHRYRVYKSIPKGHNDLVSHTNPKDCIDNNKQLFWKEKS
jgi:hypothetical protein